MATCAASECELSSTQWSLLYKTKKNITLTCIHFIGQHVKYKLDKTDCIQLNITFFALLNKVIVSL